LSHPMTPKPGSGHESSGKRRCDAKTAKKRRKIKPAKGGEQLVNKS
jgi:hypothetical protein